MASFKRVASVAAAALILPYLLDRYTALAPLYANRPGAFKEIDTFESHEVVFEDQIKNCEDAFLNEEEGWALMTCDEGRDRWNTVMGTLRPGPDLPSATIQFYDYASASPSLKPLTLISFPNVQDFHPLGMAHDASYKTLYVTNNAQSGPCIEIFMLDIPSRSARHVRTFKHDLIHAPNSIYVLKGKKDELYISNDHYFPARWSKMLSKIETYSGLAGGSIVYTDLTPSGVTKTVAHVPFANGLAMMNDSKVLVAAASSKAGLYFFDVANDHSLRQTNLVRTPAAVDNLSVDSAGTLLVGGHPFAPALERFSAKRWMCDPHSDDADKREACECRAPAWAAEWTAGGGLKELYKGNGFCSSTTVVRDRKRGLGLMTGLYAKGVFVFQEMAGT